MDEDSVLTNQTHFAAEEPLFEQRNLPPVDQETPSPVTKPRPKWLVPAAILIGVLLVLILILAVISAGRSPKVVVTPTPTPAATLSPQLDPIRQRIESAKQDLKNGDPSLDRLPFPPIDSDLRLDPKEPGR